MSGSGEVDMGYLHTIVAREVESDTIQELDPDFYRSTAEFLGGLRKQEFDGVEEKIRQAMIATATELTSLLVETRIKKITRAGERDTQNLLDEEKYILDAHEEREERAGAILSGIVHGRSKFLESVSQKHKTKLVTVRFLQDTDEMIGADLGKYGPFKAEDIATVPYENAHALIAKNVATRVASED